MGLIDKIKSDVKKSGTNKGKFIFFREGAKTRIRFLQDMDEGFEIPFHDSFADNVNIPCQEAFGRDCDLCDKENLRTRSQYCWSVWDYDAKEVKLFMFPVNNCSPVPALVALNDNYGTICDRDYVVSVSGRQTQKTYSVIPMDKNKFRNDKAKPYSKKSFLKMLDKAWPYDVEEDEEEYTSKKKRPNKSSKPTKNKKKNDDDDWDDDDAPFDDDDNTELYESMTERELYDLCKERDIDVKPKKSQKYYIKQLQEADEAEEDWEDEEDDE